MKGHKEDQGQECICRKCGYRWISRVKNPKACTRCKSYAWNEEYKREAKE